MEFSDLVKKRRAVHNFQKGYKISEKDFKKVVDLTRFTPSGYNAQPWRFILIQEEENLKKVSEIAFNQKHLVDAGSAVMIIADTEMGRDVDNLLKDWVDCGYCTEKDVPVYRNSIAKNRHPDRKAKMALRNGALAAMSFMYAVEDIGLSSCPMMGFGQKEMIEFLNLPEDHIPIMLFAVGKGVEGREKTQLPRKKVDDLIYKENFEGRF